MMFQRKRRYKNFLQSEEKIATNILAERLERLERHAIIEKTDDEYRLTPKGRDLLTVLTEMAAWGSKYDPDTDAPKELARCARRGELTRFRKAFAAMTDRATGASKAD